MNGSNLTADQFEIFRMNYLSMQKKYEDKIRELSIIKEMNSTIQQIDHIDQDLIWIRHLECLKKYKNLAAAVLYFSNENEIKRDHFFYTDFEEPFDCGSFKSLSFFNQLLSEKRVLVIEQLQEPYLFNDIGHSFYGQPILSGGKVIAVLMLFSRVKKAFEQANCYFYNIVCDHLYNNMVFLRLYYGKLDEEKQMIQLSRFFSKNVIGEIFNKKGKLKLGGEKKRVTVMFADLKGFTRLAEEMEPESVVILLNRFFSHMIPIIFKHKGTLDKLIGDGIMAVFGTPLEDQESCLNAVRCGLEMFTVLNRLNRELKQQEKSPLMGVNIEMGKGIPIQNSLEMRIGINYGELVSGFMGSEQHLNYTVIGDVVNAAQRMQALAGSNEIFLSVSVYDQISNHHEKLENMADVVRLDDVKLKGKEKLLSVYRLTPSLS